MNFVNLKKSQAEMRERWSRQLSPPECLLEQTDRVEGVCKRCKHCFESISGLKNRHAIYCSRSCKEQAWKKTSRTVRRKNKFCQICGGYLQGKGRSKFCIPCGKTKCLPRPLEQRACLNCDHAFQTHRKNHRFCSKRCEANFNKRGKRKALGTWFSETNVRLGEMFGIRTVIAIEKRHKRTFVNLRCPCGGTRWVWVDTAKTERRQKRSGECPSCSSTRVQFRKLGLTEVEIQSIIVNKIESRWAKDVAKILRKMRGDKHVQETEYVQTQSRSPEDNSSTNNPAIP